MVFQCINIRQVPWEVLKTAGFGLGFQHLPRDLANVNAWKIMFDPYITVTLRVWIKMKLRYSFLFSFFVSKDNLYKLYYYNRNIESKYIDHVKA